MPPFYPPRSAATEERCVLRPLLPDTEVEGVSQQPRGTICVRSRAVAAQALVAYHSATPCKPCEINLHNHHRGKVLFPFCRNRNEHTGIFMSLHQIAHTLRTEPRFQPQTNYMASSTRDSLSSLGYARWKTHTLTSFSGPTQHSFPCTIPGLLWMRTPNKRELILII